MTIKMIWDPQNPVFDGLKSAYFGNHPFMIEGYGYKVKTFQQSDPMSGQILEVECELEKWPNDEHTTIEPMKSNLQIHGTARHALHMFEQQKLTVHMTWAFAEWLDIVGANDLSKLEYLRKLQEHHILAAPGYKELKKLEKAASKEVR